MEYNILDKIEEFKKIRSDLAYYIQEFPEEKLEENLFEGQTLKQLVLQIVLSEMFTVAVLEDFKEGIEITWEDPYEETDEAVHSDSALDDLLEDLEIVGDKLFQVLDDYPSDLWHKKIWSHKNITPHRLLELDTEHYKENYLEQIMQHLDL